jgi:hypothetical protein
LEQQKKELENIGITLQSVEAIAEVQALAKSLVGTGVDIEQNRYFKEIHERMAQAQAALEFGGLDGSGSEFLSYDGAAVSTPIDAAVAYRSKYLAVPAPAAAADPVTAEPATDAAGFLELAPEAPAAPAAE